MVSQLTGCIYIYVHIYTHILYACVNIWYVKNLHVVTHVVDGVACLIWLIWIICSRIAYHLARVDVAPAEARTGVRVHYSCTHPVLARTTGPTPDHCTQGSTAREHPPHTFCRRLCLNDNNLEVFTTKSAKPGWRVGGESTLTMSTICTRTINGSTTKENIAVRIFFVCACVRGVWHLWCVKRFELTRAHMIRPRTQRTHTHTYTYVQAHTHIEHESAQNIRTHICTYSHAWSLTNHSQAHKNTHWNKHTLHAHVYTHIHTNVPTNKIRARARSLSLFLTSIPSIVRSPVEGRNSNTRI